MEANGLNIALPRRFTNPAHNLYALDHRGQTFSPVGAAHFRDCQYRGQGGRDLMVGRLPHWFEIEHMH